MIRPSKVFFLSLSAYCLIGLLVFRYFFLQVFLRNAGLDLSLNNQGFIGLVFSFLFLIFGAKALWEYEFQQKKKTHLLFFFVSIVLGFFAASQTKVILIGLFPALLNGLVYFYIKDYYKSMFLKNLISPLFFLIPFLFLFLFEPSLFTLYFQGNKDWLYLILKIFSFFLFAFWMFGFIFVNYFNVNSKVELNKWSDMNKSNKIIVLIAFILLTLTLVFVQIQQVQNDALYLFFYLLAFIELPLFIILLADIFLTTIYNSRIKVLLFSIVLFSLIITPFVFNYFSN